MGDVLLPQRASRANAEVLSVEWLFEPAWSGDRLLVELRNDRISLRDSSGAPADDAFSEVAHILADAILASQALIDGIWSTYPLLDDDGPPDALPASGVRRERHAFVALDLIELDGTDLHELPFQERRRLLESVIAEGSQVRLSPVVKQPVASWLVAWRQNGFRGYVAKHVNSRYHPGEVTPDWIEIPITVGRQPGFAQRMLGARDRIKRVTD